MTLFTIWLVFIVQLLVSASVAFGASINFGDEEVIDNSLNFQPVPQLLAAPRQMFIPPPLPPCRDGYMRIDGVCRFVLTKSGLVPDNPQIIYAEDSKLEKRQEQGPEQDGELSYSEVPVPMPIPGDYYEDDHFKGDGDDNNEFKSSVNKNSIYTKRTAQPDILSVPRKTDSPQCPPRHIVDHHGKCKRIFGGIVNGK